MRWHARVEGGPARLRERRRGEVARSLVYLWSRRAPRRLTSAKTLILLALPRGLEPLFSP